MIYVLKRGLSISNMYFEHKSSHNYTMVVKGQDRVEVICMIDRVLVQKDMLIFLQDVRGIG